MRLILVALATFSLGSIVVDAATIVSSEPDVEGDDITAKEAVELRRITAFATEPGGAMVAYQVAEPDVGRNEIRLWWYIASTGGNHAPGKLADGGDAILIPSGQLASPAVAWAADGRTLIYTKSVAGETQIWSIDVSTGQSRQLTRNRADVIDLLWGRNRTRLFFTVGRPRDETRESDREESKVGYLVRSETDFRLVGRKKPRDGFATTPFAPAWPQCEGVKSIPGRSEDPGRSCTQSLFVYDMQTQRERPATKSEIADYVARLETDVTTRLGSSASRLGVSARSSARDGNVAFLQNEDPAIYKGSSPVRRVAVRVPTTGETVSCLDPVCVGLSLALVGWTPSEKEVVFVRRDGPGIDSISHGSLSSIYAWAIEGGAVRAIRREEGYLWSSYGAGISARDCELRGTGVLCLREGWSQPGQIVSIDIRTGAMRVIADPNPGFERFQRTRIDKLVWSARDGRGSEVFGHLIYPKNWRPGTRYPLVVTTYVSIGFLWQTPLLEWSPVLFAQDGIMVLAVDIPMDWSVYATYEPTEATTRWWRSFFNERRPLKAIESVLDDLDALGVIDPQRVGIIGLSTGASLVDQALVLTRRFTVASSAYSNLSPLNYYLFGSSFRQNLARATGGSGHPFVDGLSVLKHQSVGINAERVEAAYLIQVADFEYYQTIGNYIDMMEAKRAVELYVFSDEYHVKWQPMHHYSVWRRNAQWFAFWLLGKEAVDPVDPQQYGRWRKLRGLRCKDPLSVRNGCGPAVRSRHQ